MRAFVIAALLLLPSASRAGETLAEYELRQGTLRLIGRFSAGHACPLTNRLALTNGHVIDQRPFDESVKPFPYAWSDGSGASGFLVPSSLERARDLATVEPLRANEVFPHPLRVSDHAPMAGDRVWFLGYDWANRKKAFGDEVIEARVTRVVALHVFFMPNGQPGSSGSCVVNDAGEVVAINEGYYETESKEQIGFSVGVWGNLWQMPQDVPVVEPFPQPRPLTDGPPKE